MNFSSVHAVHFSILCRFREIVKNKIISLSYDVSDQVYSSQNSPNYVQI